MTPQHVAVLALEFYRASGVRTPERLSMLVARLSDTYALTMDGAMRAQQLARARAGN